MSTAPARPTALSPRGTREPTGLEPSRSTPRVAGPGARNPRPLIPQTASEGTPTPVAARLRGGSIPQEEYLMNIRTNPTVGGLARHWPKAWASSPHASDVRAQPGRHGLDRDDEGRRPTRGLSRR